jgi:hypothetical protein
VVLEAEVAQHAAVDLFRSLRSHVSICTQHAITHYYCLVYYWPVLALTTLILLLCWSAFDSSARFAMCTVCVHHVQANCCVTSSDLRRTNPYLYTRHITYYALLLQATTTWLLA